MAQRAGSVLLWLNWSFIGAVSLTDSRGHDNERMNFPKTRPHGLHPEPVRQDGDQVPAAVPLLTVAVPT